MINYETLLATIRIQQSLQSYVLWIDINASRRIQPVHYILLLILL